MDISEDYVPDQRRLDHMRLRRKIAELHYHIYGGVTSLDLRRMTIVELVEEAHRLMSINKIRLESRRSTNGEN